MPFTDTFANRSNVTPFFAQNDLISLFVPGSCLPKLLAGKARTAKPLSLYFLYIDSRPEYELFVSPHLLATLTIINTSPSYLESFTSLPSMSLTVKS